MRDTRKPDRSSFGTLIGGAGVITYDNTGGWTDPQVQYSKAVDKYEGRCQAHLIEWLSSEYGVTVNDRSAEYLIKGDDVAVTFNGHDVVIDLVPVTSGNDIAVRQAGGQLLTRAK